MADVGGYDVGDEASELSGEEEIGEDEGQDGDPGSPMGYVSDSIKLISSEWCDERKDIVSLIVSGEGMRIGGGDSEIARTILGPSRGIVGVALSERDVLSEEMMLLPPTDMSLRGTGGGMSGMTLCLRRSSRSSSVFLMSWILSAKSRASAPLASLASFKYCSRRFTSCVRILLGASDGTVSIVDMIDGMSPRGVVKLTWNDGEGVGGTGDGGRGIIRGDTYDMT